MKIYKLPEKPRPATSFELNKIVDDWRAKYDLYGSLWTDRLDDLKNMLKEEMSKNN